MIWRTLSRRAGISAWRGIWRRISSVRSFSFALNKSFVDGLLVGEERFGDLVYPEAAKDSEGKSDLGFTCDCGRTDGKEHLQLAVADMLWRKINVESWRGRSSCSPVIRMAGMTFLFEDVLSSELMDRLSFGDGIQPGRWVGGHSFLFPLFGGGEEGIADDIFGHFDMLQTKKVADDRNHFGKFLLEELL